MGKWIEMGKTGPTISLLSYLEAEIRSWGGGVGGAGNNKQVNSDLKSQRQVRLGPSPQDVSQARESNMQPGTRTTEA